MEQAPQTALLRLECLEHEEPMVARAMISTASHPTTTIYGGAVSFPMTRGLLALITDSRFAGPDWPRCRLVADLALAYAHQID